MVRHKGFVLSLVGFCVLSAAAHAQVYSTGFDGVDIVNGNATAATYVEPDFAATYTSNTDPTAAGPTAPLASQNGWTSNDSTGPIGHGTFSGTNPNQINGGTNLVGTLTDNVGNPVFGGGQAAVIGGIYSPSAQTPYAVPSNASGGTVTLFHPITVPAVSSSLVLNVDFILFAGAGGSTNTAVNDTFRFVLADAAGATVMSFNMEPTSPASGQANVTGTGLGTVNSTNAVVLNGQYHLRITLTPGSTSTYTADFAGASGASQGFTGTLASPITSITQVGASWSLTDNTTTADGGLTGAGDNFLAFDNLAVTVPEPSTYALMALGVVGLLGARRWYGRPV